MDVVMVDGELDHSGKKSTYPLLHCCATAAGCQWRIDRKNKVKAAEDPDSGRAPGCTAASSRLRSHIEGTLAKACGAERGL